MNPTAIYSKSGKGVQEASGKTSQLSRADRAILSAFDGRLTVADVAERVGKPFDAKFQQVITQLDKDGFIREVSSGATPAPAKPAAAAAKPAPAAAPAKPAAKGEDLDFTIAIPASPTPKAPAKAATMAPAAAARAETEKKAQEDNMTRARREAEERQQKERDKVKAEMEAKLRAETEVKMRSEAAQKAKADAEKAKKDAEDKIRAEADAKVKAAREAAVKAAFEAERKAKEEADRIRREAEEKARKEAAELQRKLDEERRAREEAERARQEAERKVREEAERARKEAEEKARREAAELQRKLDEERRAREEAERRAREEAERARKEAERARQEAERAKQEAERAAREEAERARKETERAAREEAERTRKDAEREAREGAEREARESAERSSREEEERRSESARASEEAERLARELVEAQAEQARQQETAKPKAPAAQAGGGSFDSLLADLDSFSDREDEDKKAKEEADKKAKEEKARRQREDAEAKAREQAENKKREAEERQRKEEAERAKDEAKRKAREEEEERERKEEEERKAEEKKRKRREEALAKEAASEKSTDIGVSDDDLDMDDVKADEQAVSKESRKAAREREREAKEREKEARERAREREREAKRAAAGPAVAPVGGYRPLRRKSSWGKPIALTLFVLLAAGIGALHLMPINTQDYEKAASEAIGKPVRIGVAYLSLYNGVVLKMQNIQVGEARIATGRAYPEIGSLFNDKKTFSRIELDGVTLPQAGIGEALGVQLRSDKFFVGRIVMQQLKLSGSLPVPPLDTEVTVGPQGSVALIEARGPDNLAAKLTPVGTDIVFEATASGFTIPFLPDVTLSTFAMKGRATHDAARIESWGGATMGGAVNGSANVKWAGNTWNLDGTMTLRGINAAVFAPALLSEGNAEGTARFSMSDPDPSKFKDRGRVEGTFSLNKGVLGSFDLSRAILTGGRQATGRTPFTEMNGSGVFDRGTVALRNVTFGAGAMNATANADISPEGALSGRIVADIRTAAQNLRATINVGGTVGEPQVK